MNKVKRALSILVVLAVIFLFGWESASYYILSRSVDDEVTQEEVSPMAAFSSLITDDKEKADLDVFWTVWELLDDTYVDETVLDEKTMVYGAIRGMVSALDDPYTVYMTPEETTEFDQNLNGQLDGIGAELTVRDQSLVIVTPLKNSPAEEAGLLPGDIVYKIDGNYTSEMTLFEAIMNIRGEKGTKVSLTIIREGVDDEFDVGIIREVINVDSVSMEMPEDGIYWISINQFNDNTTPEFEAKVTEILLKEPQGIVLDLRNNGGGYLEIAVDILSEFLNGKVEALTIKRRADSDNETLYVSGKPRLADIPVVVLINDGSASAAEIVAGAIQDHKRGLIMGETSFGKGSVQEVDKLSDGSSLRLTIAKWYTPNANNIDEIGITPDVEVVLTDEDYLADLDPQLDAAVTYLKNL